MATYTATRAASTFPAAKPTGAGVLCRAYGSYTFAAEPGAGETLAICKVPAGAVITGGFVRCGDMDSDASPTLDFDVGTAADADAFGNFGVRSGAAVTNYLPEASTLLPLNGTLRDGPVTVTAETDIIVTFVDDPATFDSAAATITVCVDYVCP